MKLTWFGNTAFRIHIGGQIVVVDAKAAPLGVDANELVSGVDHVVAFDGNAAITDLAGWKPRARERLLDMGDHVRPLQIWSAGEHALLFEPDEDMPLLVIGGPTPALGRWVEKAVVVLVGQALAERGMQVVEKGIPRLMALAGADAELDAAFAELPPKLDGASLVALEPGLAVEV